MDKMTRILTGNTFSKRLTVFSRSTFFMAGCADSEILLPGPRIEPQFQVDGSHFARWLAGSGRLLTADF
jgi:hypothetical protein